MASPRQLSRKIKAINDRQEELADRVDVAEANKDTATADKLAATIDDLQEEKDALIAQLEEMTGREVFGDGTITDRGAGGSFSFDPTDREVLANAGVDVNELDDAEVAEQIGRLREREAAAAEQQRNEAARDLAEKVLGKDVSNLSDEELGRFMAENAEKFDQHLLRESNVELLEAADRDGLTEELNADLDALLDAANADIPTKVPDDLAGKVRDLDAVGADGSDDPATDSISPDGAGADPVDTSGADDPGTRSGPDFDFGGDLTFGFGGQGDADGSTGGSEVPDGTEASGAGPASGGSGSGSPTGGAGSSSDTSDDAATPDDAAPDSATGPANPDAADPDADSSGPSADGPGGPLSGGAESGGTQLATTRPVATAEHDGKSVNVYLTESGGLVTDDGTPLTREAAEAVAKSFEESNDGLTLEQYRAGLAAEKARAADDGSSDDTSNADAGSDPDAGSGADGDSDDSSGGSDGDSTDGTGTADDDEKASDGASADGVETTPDPDGGFTPVTASGFERATRFERIDVGRGGDTDPLPDGADGTDGAGGGDPEELKPVRPSDDTVIVRGDEPKPDFGSSTGPGAIDPPPDEAGDLSFGAGSGVERTGETAFGRGALRRTEADSDGREPAFAEPEKPTAVLAPDVNGPVSGLDGVHVAAFEDPAFDAPEVVGATDGTVAPAKGVDDHLDRGGDDGSVDLDGLG